MRGDEHAAVAYPRDCVHDPRIEAGVQIDVSDTRPSWAGGKRCGVIGESNDGELFTARSQGNRKASSHQVRASADPGDSGRLQMVKGIEKRNLPEVQGMVVGQGHAVHSEVDQQLHSLPRGAEEERFTW